MTIFRTIFCGVFCAFSVYGECAYGIDYSREIDEGHGVGTRYKQPEYFQPSDPNCSACDKLEPGKTDWFVRVGNDIIYGAAACSHVASSHGDVIGGIVDQGPFTNLSGKFYVPSVPVSTNTIKHEYEKNGVHCWCRITKFNNTDFNKSSWIWISGGYSKYDWPLDESKYDKSVISEERTDFLAQHCGYFCAENCYMSMDEPTYRAAMYKTINVPDTGTRCITAVVSRDSEYIPICAGMYVYVEDLDGNERDTRTDGDGKFRLCDIKGNEKFFTLSQSGATCSLLVEDDASIADYIDTDSVLKLKLDCSHGSAEDNLKDTPGNTNHTETQVNNIPTTLDNNQNTSSQHMKEKVEKSEKWLAERREKEEMLQKSLNSEQVKEAEDAYKTAKENETSLANRMLGGATMAATGIGGMQLAQGLAEQNADKKAEQDMAAYLATFQCKVGDKGGKSYSGGEMGIEVGGTNQLVNLYQQYVDLAASLKERKTALGMAPGIESQVVMDKANMGLYDAEGGKGIENGTYASLYRASRGNETDAQKLAEQKNTSATRVKGGAIAAGVGAIGGAIGNAIINSGDDDDDDIDLSKNGLDNFGYNLDGTCVRGKNESVAVTNNKCDSLTKRGTWWTSFSYGTVYGDAKCGTKAESPDKKQIPCSCKVTAVGDKKIDKAEWVYFASMNNDAGCKHACATRCASSVSGNESLRKKVLDSVDKKDSKLGAGLAGLGASLGSSLGSSVNLENVASMASGLMSGSGQ